MVGVGTVAAGASAALLALLLTVSPAAALEGDRACDLGLPDLEGKPVHLSQLKGKVVVVNFWATWCDPCREEIPDFVELYKAYQGRGLEIVGVSVDTGGEERVKAFAKKFGIEYPVVVADIQVARQWLVRGIPRTFVIDREGKVAQKIVGVTDKRSLEAGIQPLLGTAHTAR